MLWAPWDQPEGDILEQAKLDATELCIHAQKQAGIDIVSDGEQLRRHFVHDFLTTIDGLDFDNPKSRPAENVARDVADGYVCRDAAAEIFGVVIDEDGAIHEAATSGRRFPLSGN